MRSTLFLPYAAAAALLLAAASPVTAAPASTWEESGQASWYGPGFHGKRTTSGAIFDQNAMTAAHDWLPLGTRLRVTMQETGRSVVVTVTDRLPPKWLRIIDLSRGAAARLGILNAGTGMVTLTQARNEDPVEVAEAPEDDPADAVTPRRRGPRHMRHVARTASADLPCCRAPSAAQAPR